MTWSVRSTGASPRTGGPRRATTSVRHRRRPAAWLLAAALILATLVAVPLVDPPAAEAAPGSAGFHTLTPARILDTRSGIGGPMAKLGAGQVRELDVTGPGGVPNDGVTAVILNVTAVSPTAPSHLTVWPSGVPQPLASNLNFVAGDVVPNLVTVKVGSSGKVSFFNNSGSVDLVADVAGWFDDGTADGDPFVGVTPARLLDTRDGTGGPSTPFGSGVSRQLDVTGVGGVPTNASAVVLNVTAVNGTAPSHLTVWPAGVTRPEASNLNFGPGQVRPNLVVVKVGGNGNVALFNNSGSVHVVADVVGWFGPLGTPGMTGGGFEGITPSRLLDTRDGTGGPATKFGGGATRTLDVTGVGGVPAHGVGAVVLNVTAVNGSAPSHLTVWPADVAMPLASNLNFVPGQVVPNLVMVKVSADGAVNLFNNAGDVDVIADVVGWYKAIELDDSVPVPDPVTVAPPLDPTERTPFPNGIRFLVEGPNPVQRGAVPAELDPQRLSVGRGRVVDRDGNPLDGVRVAAPDHPELGHTLSRADGVYDIVVNGGAPVLLRFTKDGFLDVQRWLPAPANDFRTLDDVALIPLDPAVTTVTDGAAGIQVVTSSPVDDDRGTRRSTLLFPANEDAKLRMPDGTLTDVGSLAVRATEYTVGTTGPEAMPGELPPNSAYTFATEVSADEAIDAGATSVEFSKPYVHLVPNFVGFPVGAPVPMGYYDKALGQWVAEPDGRVIKVVSESGGNANLDVTGDGVADTGAALTSLGITTAERTVLAQQYAPGDELWRTMLDHFTAVDMNFPPRCQDACESPKARVGAPQADTAPFEGCTATGSIIGCQAQTLGESVPVVGTDYALRYDSSTADGFVSGRRITIPITGATVPPGLVRTAALVEIAGRRIELAGTTSPGSTASFTWDGLDVYGREVVGSAFARVTVIYAYQAYYGIPSETATGGFGNPPASAVGVAVAGQEVLTSTETTVRLDANHVAAAGLGGWSIDRHHSWQPGALALGDGRVMPIGEPTGMMADLHQSAFGVSAGSGNTTLVRVGNQHQRRAADGSLSVVAGSGAACPTSRSPCDEGLQATAARLNPRSPAKEAPDGTVYFVDGVNCTFQCGGAVIRRVLGDGTLVTVAGSGAACAVTDVAACGNNVAATQAAIDPQAFVVDPAGTLWILERPAVGLSAGTGRVRSIGADGVIRTQYGCLTDCPSLAPAIDGQRAAGAGIRAAGMELAPDGSLVLLEQGASAPRVLRIDPAGVLHIIAGGTGCGGASDCGEYGPATAYRFEDPFAIDVDDAGQIYVVDTHGSGARIVRFRPGGPALRVAGSNRSCSHPENCADGVLATEAVFDATGIAVGSDGSIFLAQGSPSTLHRIAPPPRTPDGLVVIPSDDASELYLFDPETGRHRRTVNGLTGAVTESFTYADGRLTGIADADGNVTTITRDGTGAPTAIVSPYGLATALTVDGNGHLASVTPPGRAAITFTTSASGLLTGETIGGPQPASHTFTYDADGLLTQDDGPSASTALSRSSIPNGTRVTLTSAQGRTRTYDTVVGPDGTRTVTSIDESGAVTVVEADPNGNETLTTPDGAVVTTTYGAEPRFGLVVTRPTTRVETYPGGLVRTTTFTRTAALDPADPSKVAASTTKIAVNGNETTESYDAGTRTRTVTTPEGRVETAVFDAEGHVVSVQAAAGLTPDTFAYRADGRVTQRAQGAATWTYEYDSAGRQVATVDPTGRRISRAFDAASRVASSNSADPARPYTFGYDERGNLTGVHAPTRPNGTGGADYAMGFDAADRQTGYAVPGTSAESSVWSVDGDLESTTLATGQDVSRTYDGGGRLTGISWPGGSVTSSYLGATGRVDAATRTRGAAQTTTYGYAGPFVTSMTMTGLVTANLSATWNADLRVSSIGRDGPGAGSESYMYDKDGLPTAIGPVTVVRGAPGGRVSSMTDGAGTFTLGYDAAGREQDRTLAFGATAFQEQLQRDAAGRTTSSTVTTPSGTITTTYAYDALGRLATSKRGAAPTVTYTYDHHGNLQTTAAGAATFNATDQLVSVAGVPYTYDANGALTGRGADTFTRDASGELLGATVGGVGVTYAYDHLNRRVARTEGGVTTEYLYGDPRDALRVTDTRVGGVATHYVYQGQRVIALERGGVRYLVGTDSVGSLRVIRNADGSTVKVVDYDPWGNVLGDSNPGFAVELGFAGGIRDGRTGWTRFGVRDYDPATGRFTSADPIRFDGGLARYGYANGDPVNMVDPAGTTSIGGEFFFGAGGGAQLSWGTNGWTICVTVGLGVGAGVSGDLNAANAEASTSIVASISGGDIAAGGGISAERSTDECGRTSDQVTIDANTGPIQGQVGGQYDEKSGKAWDVSSLSVAVPKEVRAGASGKIGYKVCKQYNKLFGVF